MPLVQPKLVQGHAIAPLTGRVVDQRYLVGRVLGQGGMGVVYEAENLRTGRRCAAKFLHTHLHADDKARQRLFREVQGASRIRHPNVVEIFDYGEDKTAGAYLVMEFLEGRTVGQLMRKGSGLSVPEAIAIALGVAAGLAATHAQGLLHRDIKPSNVRVLPGGQAKVLDFGLVKSFGADDDAVGLTLTSAGMIFGTPEYMSPEQTRSRPLDQRSDIYGLGVLFYAMLMGRPPFHGRDAIHTLHAHCNEPVPWPDDSRRPLPATLKLLVMRMLSKQPDERHQSMLEVIQDLQAVADRERLTTAEPSVESGPALPAETEPLELLGEQESSDTIEVQDGQRSADLAMLRERWLAVWDQQTLRVATALQKRLPSYANAELAEICEQVNVFWRSILGVLDDPPRYQLRDDFKDVVRHRLSSAQVTPAEYLCAFWVGYGTFRPLLRDVAGEDVDGLLTLTDALDRRLIPFYLRLLDLYISEFANRLTQLNAMLGRRTDELERLRQQLRLQVDQTATQLAHAERYRAAVVEAVPTGLLLIDGRDERLLLFNQTMARLTGIPAAQVLGRRLEEIEDLVEGVPLGEFRQQMREHDEVGLRRLEVQMPNGASRVLYVRGLRVPALDGRGANGLFVVEDVTERERVLRALSRHIPGDVADRVLSGRRGRGSDEPRDALLMVIGLKNFDALLKADPAVAAERLGELVALTHEAVSRRHGAIEGLHDGACMAYFVGEHAATVRSAVRAAGHVLKHARQVQGLELSVGIARDTPIITSVGNRRRAIQTIVGQGVERARRLQRDAAAGQVLLDGPASADELGAGIELSEVAEGRYSAKWTASFKSLGRTDRSD